MSQIATRYSSVEEIENSLTEIGRGSFSRAYLDAETNIVYSVTYNHHCRAKKYLAEIIEEHEGNIPKHIPRIKKEFVDGNYTVYSMPYYFRTTCDDVYHLEDHVCHGDFYSKQSEHYDFSNEQYFIGNLSMDTDISASIRDAVKWIYYKVMDKLNYFEYLYWDFYDYNMGEDENGNLILLDVFATSTYRIY